MSLHNAAFLILSPELLPLLLVDPSQSDPSLKPYAYSLTGVTSSWALFPSLLYGFPICFDYFHSEYSQVPKDITLKL